MRWPGRTPAAPSIPGTALRSSLLTARRVHGTLLGFISYTEQSEKRDSCGVIART